MLQVGANYKTKLKSVELVWLVCGSSLYLDLYVVNLQKILINLILKDSLTDRKYFVCQMIYLFVRLFLKKNEHISHQPLQFTQQLLLMEKPNKLIYGFIHKTTH